jgi:thiol-disulfide isomerase/thioredoxin
MKTGSSKIPRFKAIMNIAFIILSILFLVLLFVFKGNLNDFVSKKMKEQAGIAVLKSIPLYVDSAFNYKKNGEKYRLTFLEFGATGCISCKMMEKVMNEVKIRYPFEIKVKFVNILLAENQDLMNYFGIAAIPTQVLLDVSGKEVFRHTGYFSFNDLEKEFQKIKP